MKNYRFYKKTEYPFPEAFAGAVFLSVYTICCFYSTLWMLRDVFPEWQMTPGAQVWIWGLVFFTCITGKLVDCLQVRKNLRWIWGLVGFGFYGLLFWRYIKGRQIDFEDGSCAFAFRYLEKFNAYINGSIQIWRGKKEFLGMSLAVWFCMAILSLLLLVILFRKRFIMLLLPASALAALLMIGRTPGFPGTASFFAVVLFVSSGEAGSGQNPLQGTVKNQKYGRLGIYLQRLLCGGCLAAACFAAVAAGSVLAEKQQGTLLAYAPWAKDVQKKIEQNIIHGLSGYSVKQREEITNQTPHYTGKEVIKVSASKKPETDVYLRGFYGTDYENGSWICRSQDFADACARADCTQEQAAEQLLQAGYDALLAGYFKLMTDNGMRPAADTREYEIDYTLEYTGIDNRYAYLPYFTDPVNSREKSWLTGDVLVQKERGQKTFSVSGWNGALETYYIMMQIYEAEADPDNVFTWYDGLAEQAYLAGSDRVPSVSEFLEQEDREDMEVQLSIMPGLVSVDTGADLIKDSYLRLMKAWTVCEQMKKQFFYNLNPGPLPAGEDAVEYFLAESHEGFCIHFASAAVLILREYGIPARYVSGYVAKKEDFRKSGEQYAASVRDYDAHAWAEIYLDGFGWVPVDATPGAGRQAAEQKAGEQSDTQTEEGHTDDTHTEDTQAEDSGTEDSQTEDSHTEDTKTEDEGQNPGAGGASVYGGKNWPAGLGISIAAVLSLAVLWFLYRIIRRAVKSYYNVLKREMRGGQYRNAVLRINRRIYRSLRLHGRIRKNSMTDGEYEKVLALVYPDIPKSEWMHYMQIIKEAAFSKDGPEAADAYFCWEIYQRRAHTGRSIRS